MSAGGHCSLQGTVSREIRFNGQGLHTGKHAQLVIKPATPGQGIIFHITDRDGRATPIKADWRNIRDMPLCTCLTDGTRTQIRTVEHLMAAFYGCSIDNAMVHVQGSEIPLLDGSAKPFVDAMAGVVIHQNEPRRVIKITKALQVEDGPRWIKIEPHPVFRAEVQTYVEPFGRLPWWACDVDRDNFAGQIAPARTFGSLRDATIAKLLTWFLPNPICLGANRRNAVAIFRGRVVTPGGLRFPDEFTRHRALDLIGDLMLAGTDFQAKFTCFSPTHRLTRKALQAIFSDPDSHVMCTADSGTNR
jgi:UDP-3-O-[3-hydroxymyristoyl] N-acetylglucosamine deacetylase